MSKKTSEWEQKFDKKFSFIKAFAPTLAKEVKSFLAFHLAKEKMELIKKIEGLRKVMPEEELQDYTRGWYVGANEVLDDLLSEIQEEVGG